MWVLFRIDENKNTRALVCGALSTSALEFPNKGNVESFILHFTPAERLRIVAANRRANGKIDEEYFLPARDWMPCGLWGDPKPPELTQALRREGMTSSMSALLRGATEEMTDTDFLGFSDAEPGSRKYEWRNEDGWSMIVIYNPAHAVTCTPDGTPTWEFEVYFTRADMDQPFCERYAIPFTAVETTTLM